MEVTLGSQIANCLRTLEKGPSQTWPLQGMREMTAVFQPRSCSFSGYFNPSDSINGVH